MLPIFSFVVIKNEFIGKGSSRLVLFKFTDNNNNKLGDRVFAINKAITLGKLYLMIFIKIKSIIVKRKVSKALKKKLGNQKFSNKKLFELIKGKYSSETGLVAGFFSLIFKLTNLHPQKQQQLEITLDEDFE